MSHLRPIAMTTIAAILGLLPLAPGIGQGLAMQQRLAIVIVSGLLVQMPLGLPLSPTLSRMLQRGESREQPRGAAAQTATAPLVA